jgi:hypothetical protein
MIAWVALATCALAATAQAEVVELASASVEDGGVRVDFPAVVYEPFALDGRSAAEACARVASEVAGVRIDVERDLAAESTHRVLLRDPADPRRILKVYRPDRNAPGRIARLIQRELGVQGLLQARGVRIAALEASPAMIRRGVLRQRRIDGRGLHEVFPNGYRIGDHPAVDRLLARVAAVDAPLRSIVSRQTGLLLANTVDCREERAVGIDFGHCYGNVFLETATDEPIFIDW